MTAEPRRPLDGYHQVGSAPEPAKPHRCAAPAPDFGQPGTVVACDTCGKTYVAYIPDRNLTGHGQEWGAGIVLWRAETRRERRRRERRVRDNFSDAFWGLTESDEVSTS
jgi:hypothetical protein